MDIESFRTQTEPTEIYNDGTSRKMPVSLGKMGDDIYHIRAYSGYQEDLVRGLRILEILEKVSVADARHIIPFSEAGLTVGLIVVMGRGSERIIQQVLPTRDIE